MTDFLYKVQSCGTFAFTSPILLQRQVPQESRNRERGQAVGNTDEKRSKNQNQIEIKSNNDKISGKSNELQSNLFKQAFDMEKQEMDKKKQQFFSFTVTSVNDNPK